MFDEWGATGGYLQGYQVVFWQIKRKHLVEKKGTVSPYCAGAMF